MKKPPTILVTGSSGFFGRWLVADLHKFGYQVIGIDRAESPFNQPRLSSFFLHDLRKPLVRDLPNFEACIHLASDAGGFLKNAHTESLVDTELTLLQNVHRLCAKKEDVRFIYTSSINVFETTGAPHEETLGNIKQKTPYARAKTLGESFIEKNVPYFNILRPTNYFGADQSRDSSVIGESHVIPELLHKIRTQDVLHVLGHGEQVRNFLHVSDLSRLILMILNKVTHQKLVYLNVRSELFISIGELANLLMDYAHVKKPIQFDARFSRYETAPITPFAYINAQSLGWAPKINSIYEGLRLRCITSNTKPTNTKDTHISAF